MILADKYALYGLKVCHLVGGEVMHAQMIHLMHAQMMHLYMSIRASESASRV